LAARGEYLQGNWFQTEELVAQILRRNPRDVEARLLKATLLRHTGRWDEAREQLRQLQRLEGAGSWNMEIEREWLLQSAAARTRRSSQVSPHATANPLRRAA
jgi:protein involved in temperature-dependent protein secretion